MGASVFVLDKCDQLTCYAMNVKIEESWRKRLQEEFDKPYFEQLVTFVKNSYFLPVNLLNTFALEESIRLAEVFTAEETGSHRNMGWETFTDAVIKKLAMDVRILYSCCGEVMQKRRSPLSTPINTWC